MIKINGRVIIEVAQLGEGDFGASAGGLAGSRALFHACNAWFIRNNLPVSEFIGRKQRGKKSGPYERNLRRAEQRAAALAHGKSAHS